MMNAHTKSIILEHTGASGIFSMETIQELWSGYGKIMRVELKNASRPSVVVKHVQFPSAKSHPRGWNTPFAHQRKVKSYQVETAWYQTYSKNSLARVPECLGVTIHHDDVIIILEDLDSSGFDVRKSTVRWQEIQSCLQWLAQFHAGFLGKEPTQLWPIGTYWHLATRPQELTALTDLRLRKAAPLIDKKLNTCVHQTLVHGDAKLANFCFSKQGGVAGVDFQYVGGGCGMKDVAYFIGSCLPEHDCQKYESRILDTYFEYLQQALKTPNKALESEWRSLYRFAWADFHRFLKGWSPGHWKINSYSEQITAEVINGL